MPDRWLGAVRHDPVWQTMWANRPRVKDGMFEVGAGPGFGLVLDEAMVRKYRVS